MSLQENYLSRGAELAPDGIPLHFGDQRAEYQAALNQAVLMDRSHEGRMIASGRDRINLLQRISTNDLSHLASGEGRPTIFTNANGRIIDRIMVYNRGDEALLTTEPGRGNVVLRFLQRQIFFNDEVVLSDLEANTHQFALHGPQADAVMDALVAGSANIPSLHAVEGQIAGVTVFATRRKPLSERHWAIIVPKPHGEVVWNAILQAGAEHGLIPAGSLTYNALRIRAGRPGIGHELTTDYIPLEAGLWDEVSFSKGCYTGQEIIARMESRNRLAKTMVTLRLSAHVEAPAQLIHEEKTVGTLTSSVTTPDNEILGIGFVKVPLAVPGTELQIGKSSVGAEITALAGAPAPQLSNT